MQACKFDLKHYRHILKTALKAGYCFEGFGENLSKRSCILRHDVDYMPEWALRFGEIERGLGIRSSFFFQVSAKTYNLTEPDNCEVAVKLCKMGHSVGLHCSFNSLETPAETCTHEKKLFELITTIVPDKFVSIHCPAKNVLGEMVEGVRHSYEPEYFGGPVKYLSDSTGWYEGCICKIFSAVKYKQIQLLLHPYLWHEISESHNGNIRAVVDFRNNELRDYVLKYHSGIAQENGDNLDDCLG